ncbi:hypothetical protein Tco_0260058 [Tanacetum coccineum]
MPLKRSSNCEQNELNIAMLLTHEVEELKDGSEGLLEWDKEKAKKVAKAGEDIQAAKEATELMADPLMYVGQLMMFLKTPIFKTFRERDGTRINDKEYRIYYHLHQLEVSFVFVEAVIDEKSSIPSTNATDQIASGDSLSTKVNEAVSGETGTGKTVTDSTTSKKRKRNQRAKKTAASDVFSAKVDEVVSGETVMGKTVTDDTTPKKKKKKRNKKKKKVAGDIMSAKVYEIVSGETVPNKAVTDNTTPEKKKMKVAVADDILSTCENVQGKGNAIEGLSATDITESLSGEMVSVKIALPDVKMVSQEKHTEATNRKMGLSATPNLNVNGVVPLQDMCYYEW